VYCVIQCIHCVLKILDCVSVKFSTFESCCYVYCMYHLNSVLPNCVINIVSVLLSNVESWSCVVDSTVCGFMLYHICYYNLSWLFSTTCTFYNTWKKSEVDGTLGGSLGQWSCFLPLPWLSIGKGGILSELLSAVLCCSLWYAHKCEHFLNLLGLDYFLCFCKGSVCIFVT